MHDNKDCVENRSQRNKLEKLARWRIDPSLIEFPREAREFCGGFAKVSQGLFTSPSRAKGGASEPKEITDELPSSKAGELQSENDTQEPGVNYRTKDEEADSQTADGDDDNTEGEGTKDNNKEQTPHDQTSIPKAISIPYPNVIPKGLKATNKERMKERIFGY
ncbi:hypothetical protein FS837_000906 [Tulasnella sp. UAMH 9824]|nr:hypothetical protein FS837_000906 [Tulasnella sp. UAMH 9824]